MIVRMRQLTILVTKESIDSALIDLRRLGVVHISHLKVPHADYIDRVRMSLSRIDKVLGIIGESEKQKKLDAEELVSASEEIVALWQQKSKLIDDLSELESKTGWFKEWGDVSKEDLDRLEEHNIFIKLYVCSKKDFEKAKKDNLVYVINRQGSNLHIAHITTDRDKTLNFRALEAPPEKFSRLKQRGAWLREDIEKIENKLGGFSAYRGCFAEYRNNLLKKFEFIKVKFGMARDESLAWLKGYCPLDSVESVKETADKKGWGIVVQKPDKPQDTPTLLKNPRWIDIIKPVFNFMGTLPGYKEYDISFWFLLFFSLFFSMLIGDAGYGLVFLIATYLFRRKFKQAPAAAFFLVYVLAISTIIWGALSGTWFGAENIAKLPFLNFLIIDRINSFAQSNQSFMIYFCFIVGATHLSIAHCIKAFRYINSPKALAEIGWVCILWTAFFIAGKLVLNRTIPDFTITMGIIGMAAVVLFSNFQKNILKGALTTLGTLPLDVISSFSDIVSYLRLFAVGYASVVLAMTTNDMALSGGANSFLAGLGAAIILFTGHLINILLGLLAVIVHGVRLNMLEFSGQLGMEWSGKEYRPFRE